MASIRMMVALAFAALAVASLPAAAADGFDPAATQLALVAGGSQTVEQTLHLDALPQKADVVIAIDTTGSMQAAINDAKTDAVAIVNDVQARMPGARFAVVDFKDYPFSPYGLAPGDIEGYAGDFPYLLRTDGFTSSSAAVQAAFDQMSAFGGLDSPESHNRVFLETYTDPELDWDPQATRILIMLTDAIPHDNAQSTRFTACRNTGGPSEGTTDPGPDDIVGSTDDPRTAGVIDGLVAHNTTLSVITYATLGADPTAPACLKALAEATGGRQVARGETSTLLALIQRLVTEQAQRIQRIEFQVQKPEGWDVTFTPPTPYGPFTAPRDIPFDVTVEAPLSATGSGHAITVKAIVDGAERATFSITADIKAQAVGALTLDVDRRSIRAGIASFSPSVVPAARIPFFGGASVASTPVGSVPVGSVPVGSVPVGSVPVGSVPVGSVGLLSLPVGSVPVGSVPVGSVPVGSVPVGSVGLDDILLSSLPLAPSSGTTWAEILAGTALAGRPLQTLTLDDVAALALTDTPENVAALARFNALQLKDVPFFSSLLRGVKLASVLLGNVKLNQLTPPGGAASWETLLDSHGGDSTGVDPATNTVLGLDIAGRLGSTPVGSVPVGSVPFSSPVGSVPVGSVPVGSVDLRLTRLASVLVSVLGPTQSVVDCSGGYCTSTRTLGQAQVDGKILPTATLADLDPALDATGITLAELIAAMLGLENYPWAQVPLVGLQDVAGTGERARYTAELDVDCTKTSGLANMKLALPPGFVPVAGSARWTIATGAPITGADAVKERAAFRWPAPAGVCGSGVRHVKFEVDTFAGLQLGDFTTTATATAAPTGPSFSTADEDEPRIFVSQNHESNDTESTPTAIEKNRVYVFHVGAAGDDEVFSLPIPARNTRTRISLNVPDGADFDLVVGRPEALPLNSAPVGSVPVGSVPVGSVPLPDEGATTNDALRSPQPDTLQDIPVGSVPVGSVSASRGSQDEAVQLVSDGTAGAYTVTVSGYNGSRSPTPAAMYVNETPAPPLPPCSPRSFAHSSTTFGTLPASLPASTRTLFLVNRNQMARLHGETAVQELLAYIGDQVTPGKLAARPEILGSILELDGSEAVRTAYGNWNESPCSVAAANDVVRAANDVVGSYLASLPNLEYVVLLGSDEVVPSGRVPDPTLISPELDNASDLAFTTADLTNGNALYAAAADNQMLTDSVYGAFTEIPWHGRQLSLPQVAVSRLLESPDEIGGQLAQYELAQGLLQATTAYVTGYDFLTDGAEAVSAGLTRPNLVPTLQTSPQWTKTTVENEFFAAPSGVPHIGSINAHYNHYLAQPAAATTAAELFSTSIVPNSLPGRILFTMGCHAGLNVADSLLSGTVPPDALDWAQRYAQAKVAVYVANYTFGYGDTEAVALSERLMALFGSRVGADNRSLAAQWLESLHTYFATAGTTYGVYDEKALVGANLMGPPWYRVSGAPAATTPATTPTTTAGDGLVVASRTLTPSTTAVGPGSGGGPTFWTGESVLATHHRPVQPVVSDLINAASGTPPARGIFITALTTHDVPDVKPVLARPTIDLGAHEPSSSFDETFFPANYVLLARTGEQTRAVVSAGQFRPTPGSDRGTQRLVDSISFEVAFDGDEAEAPHISEVGAVVLTPSSVRVFVRATDAAGFRRAAALVNDGAAAWRFVSLAHQGGGLFTADVTGLATSNPEIVAEVQNVHGYTGYSTKKGENFNPITTPGGPDFQVDTPRPGDVYLLNEVVVPRFSCSGGAGVQSCTGPSVLDTSTVGDRTYTVTSTDILGNTTTHVVPYKVWYAFDGFKQPVDNNVINIAKAGNTIPLKWQLRDVAGAFQRDLNSFTSLSSRETPCSAGPSDPLPIEPVTSVSGLRYDTATEQFVFNFATQKSWKGKCRTVYLLLADGSPAYTAVFSFK